MKHIHFVGICGVGMSALAILWKKQGWMVTGSDAGFYPPISTHLTRHGVAYYPGWHPEKMGRPDLAVIGSGAGSGNPEWKFARENKIPCVSYPELIAQNLIKPNSIVCAGTYGKTSSTALLVQILISAGYHPAYMFGGISLDLKASADNPPGTLWSVLEGDEYRAARWDERAKFLSYRATHLLLTSVEWDHADLYPTAEDYNEAFKKLISALPDNGLIVASEKVPPEILSAGAEKKIIKYGKNENDYAFANLKPSATGLEFDIVHAGETYPLSCPVIGEYNADNICGVFALARGLGVKTEVIAATVKNWHGLKRRLEKRGRVNEAPVFDDIAHSPAKAKAVLGTLRKIYSGKIFAIFEPNAGNRRPAAAAQYDRAFADADVVLTPRLTKIKTRPGEKIIAGPELAEIISKTHNQVKYFEDDNQLISFLKQNARPEDAVVFLGSHGFRGMIENAIA